MKLSGTKESQKNENVFKLQLTRFRWVLRFFSHIFCITKSEDPIETYCMMDLLTKKSSESASSNAK